MTGGRYIWNKISRTWVDVRETRSEPKDLHFIQEDTMEPLMNHVDGKIYDSKSAFRRATKAAGAYEIGNAKVDIEKLNKERDAAIMAKRDKQIEGALRQIVTQGPASWEKALGHD